MRRWAVTIVFFGLGIAEGAWAARIPAIKAALHLSPGVLGLALLGPALGCVLAMPATGAVLASRPPRRLTQLGLLLFAVLLPVTTLTGSAWQLFLVLAGWGAGIGICDVAMNTEAAAVQDELGRRVMSGFHGSYSVGGLAGGALGAVAAATGVSARATFLLAATVIVVSGLGAAQLFARTRPASPSPATASAGAGAATADLARPGGPETGAADTKRPGRARRLPQLSWTLAALGAMSFASFLAEGSASNWSAVYLHSSLGAPASLAAIGFTVFAAAMAAGRLSGDWLADRLGPATLVRASAGMATAGFAAALLIGHVWAALIGYALLGGGLSVVVPLAFTGAAGLGAAGPNLALVTSCGYLGSLIGPAIIGGLADLTSLPAALGFVVLLSALIVVLARAVRPRRATAGPPIPQQAAGVDWHG